MAQRLKTYFGVSALFVLIATFGAIAITRARRITRRHLKAMPGL
jgi:hypothetical protein